MAIGPKDVTRARELRELVRAIDDELLIVEGEPLIVKGIKVPSEFKEDILSIYTEAGWRDVVFTVNMDSQDFQVYFYMPLEWVGPHGDRTD